jgi:hypothetical protein
MRLPLLDTALWAAGPLLNAALFCVIYLRRRLGTFPVLASWCAFTIVSAIALFFIYRQTSHHTYAVAYWVVEGVDALLQIGVVAEVANIVFRPRGSVKKNAVWFVRLTICGAFIAFAIVWWIRPAALTRAGMWEIRGDLFTSLVVSGTFTLVLIMSQKQGLHWRSHVMSIGYGLMVWAVVTLIIGLLHGYWGRYTHYLGIEHFRMLVYMSMLCYWIVALWQNEPEREHPSQEMRDAILHVTDKVSYDLAKVLGTRGKELH